MVHLMTYIGERVDTGCGISLSFSVELVDIRFAL